MPDPEGVAAARHFLEEGFEDALRRGVHLEERLELAGRPARLRIVGPELGRRILRAWRHLPRSASGSEPETTIDLWSEAESGVRYEGFVPTPEETRRLHVQGTEDGRYVVHRRPHMVSVLDRRRGRLVGWAAGPDRLALPDLGRPFKEPLLIRLRDLGFATLHAGLVARDGVGILLPGPGGSGKTTCAVACLEAGFDYVCDDFVAVEQVGAGGFVGHGLYGSAHLDPAHLRRFPRLATRAVPGRLPGEDKSWVPVWELFAGRLRPSAPIRALVLPRVTGTGGVSLKDIRRGEALVALAPTSLMQLPLKAPGRGLELARLAAVVGAVECRRLEIGGPVNAIAPVLEALVHRMAAPRASAAVGVPQDGARRTRVDARPAVAGREGTT